MSIRDDLFKRIRNKHYDWAQDSASLYEMGELGSRAVAEDIMTIVVDFVANGAIALELDKVTLHEALDKCYERRMKRRQRDELQ